MDPTRGELVLAESTEPELWRDPDSGRLYRWDDTEGLWRWIREIPCNVVRLPLTSSTDGV